MDSISFTPFPPTLRLQTFINEQAMALPVLATMATMTTMASSIAHDEDRRSREIVIADHTFAHSIRRVDAPASHWNTHRQHSTTTSLLTGNPDPPELVVSPNRAAPARSLQESLITRL